MATNQEIVQSDIQNMYLGNLRTVEFDLKLPGVGKAGSDISWETSDERFIKPDGTVNRPSYGRGDRLVTLTATFRKGDYSEQSTYAVNVLEEGNDIVISKIYPVKLTHEIGETFYLPQVVAIKTAEGKILPQYVEWDNGERCNYEEPGNYQIHGHIKASNYDVLGQVTIQTDVDSKSNRTKVVGLYPLKDVTLTPGTPVAQAQQNRLAALKQMNDDQMLYNFRIAAGLDTKGAPEMIGWDAPDSQLRGHTTGHYLSGLAQAYAATADREVLQKLNYMVSELAKVQKAFVGQPGIKPGFLSAYNEDQFDQIEEFTPYPTIWAPYYTLHKILAGLIDAYQLADSKQALDIAIGIGHWVFNRLSRLDPIKMKKMWAMYIAGEIGGINESLATLGELTGEQEFIKAAQYFDNDKLFFPLLQNVDALGSMHANQHIPQIIAAITLYGATKEERYYQIAKRFWQNVTRHRVYSFGGTGDNEMFWQPDEIGTKLDVNSAESCASYNMIKLTTDLYSYEPDAEKMAYYENTLLNHILSSTDHEPLGQSTYFMPTNPGEAKTFVDENSCCHGTGLESQFKYGEAIYAESTERVLINLLLASHLSNDTEDLTIDADFDHPETATIKINRLTKPLAIRQPAWSPSMTVKINGQVCQTNLEGGYAILPELHVRDVVTVVLDPKLRIVPTPDKPKTVSIAFGPYVLAALSGSKKYIHFNVREDNDLVNYFRKDEGRVAFTANGIKLVPLYSLYKEPYSIYFHID